MEREREELDAALEARKELGAAYEPELVDRFLERIEQRLQERRGRSAEPEPPHHEPPAIVVPLASIGMGIPITAIAVGNDATAVAIIAWLAIAIVNVAYALRRR
jgi:hypothetical protein